MNAIPQCPPASPRLPFDQRASKSALVIRRHACPQIHASMATEDVSSGCVTDGRQEGFLSVFLSEEVRGVELVAEAETSCVCGARACTAGHGLE